MTLQRLPIIIRRRGWGAPLVFNSGDQFSIRKVLIALDQNGRGKGDLINSVRDHGTWPNQQQETCFSWNNKNTDTGQVLGYRHHNSNQHAGSDYVNLGAGLPANQIPAQVTAAYPAGVNGGSAYNHEYHVSASFGDRRPKSHAHPDIQPNATAYADTYSNADTDLNASIERINLQWGDSIC